MTRETESQRFARIARATADIAPAPGFDDWVMEHVRRAPPAESWFSRTVLLGCFAAAAAAAILVSQVEQRQLDSGALSVLDSFEAQP